jgi:D-beta-D-heptose 7-phosphate kinase/D-beta-D-heptose 1-phosphate adenosyltransferase
MHGPFDVERAAASLLPQLDGTAILATRSADGMTLFRAGAAPFHVPAMAKEVFDVTGAGDTVVATADAVVLSDYAKGVITPAIAQHTIRVARAARVPVVVDPKQRSFGPYAGAAVITPNLHELEAAAPPMHGAFDVERAAASLLPQLDGTAILATRSADGMTLFRAGAAPFHVPAMAKEVFDVTGAGDTVVATVALALAARIPMEAAVELASVAAAISVSKRGTSTVSPAELAAALPA